MTHERFDKPVIDKNENKFKLIAKTNQCNIKTKYIDLITYIKKMHKFENFDCLWYGQIFF